jgi:hypothetical protein
MKKLSLEMDTLEVESFEAGHGQNPERGTVEAFVCTGRASCACPSSIYQCGTIAATFSCRTQIDC